MMGGVKTLVTNRKARRDYTIREKVEAGIVLKGTEVKSLRGGRGSFAGSYAKVEGGEVWLYGFHISPYEHAGVFSPDPTRPRKLLLKKREIKKLDTQASVKGFTLVPLRLYLKRGLVKMELGVGEGKRQYDKRETIKKREAKREAARALKFKMR